MQEVQNHNFAYALPQIADAAQELLARIQHQYVLFDAPMGAGKTTLIRELIKQLSPMEFLGSPTFSLVNEYRTYEGGALYHFDLYRLKSPEELMDIGFDEYLSQAEWIFIEWPERAWELMPFPHTLIHIKPENKYERTLEILNL